MKYLLFSMTLIFSSFTMASYNSVATPYVPCFVDGEYVGTIEYTHCKKRNGKMTKQGSKAEMH